MVDTNVSSDSENQTGGISGYVSCETLCHAPDRRLTHGTDREVGENVVLFPGA